MHRNLPVVRATPLLGPLLALLLAFAPQAIAQNNNWTCSGGASAICALQLFGCAAENQTCITDINKFSSDFQRCACLTACQTSAQCPSGQACSAELGGRCTPYLACNTSIPGSACPLDAMCVDGTCRRPDSCQTSIDCPLAAPDCLRGSCVVLAPGQCTNNAQCNADPCAPATCDVSAGRCVVSRSPPCGAMPGAKCLATSATGYQCMVPACTSDAQCSTDVCIGTPQRCNVATGRCMPGNPPCQDGTVCAHAANAPSFTYCAPTRPDPVAPGLGVGPFDTSDLQVIWNPEPTGAGGGGRAYVLRAWLPAGALRAGARPSALRLAIAGADRGLAVAAAVAAGGKSPHWTRDAATGGWRWQPEAGARGAIDAVVVAPVAREGGRARVEVRGHAVPGVGELDPRKSAYAARIDVDWDGPAPYSTRVIATIDKCIAQKDGARAVIACSGKSLPR